MKLGGLRQEVAGMEERAITRADDPHIKVLFSPTHKSKDSSLASIFSLLVWPGGWIEQWISAVARFILPENGGKASLNIAARHTIT